MLALVRPSEQQPGAAAFGGSDCPPSAFANGFSLPVAAA